MRVYAICRQCAEVHLASTGCPGCTRTAAIGRRGEPSGPAPGPDVPGDALGGARGETTALVEQPRRRRVWLSATVLGAYLLAILGLLAAVLLGQGTAI
jgi:hypothetical protein